MRINSAKDLDVYKKGYDLAMRIFQISKGFPNEERFALTGQIRRSSRSVCLNLREAWAKRRYEARFVSKLTDCDGENSETDSSLDFAKDCGYISGEQHADLTSLSREVGKMLGSMINNPGRFLVGQSSETSGQRSEVRRQKSEIGRQRSEIGDQTSEISEQMPDVDENMADDDLMLPPPPADPWPLTADGCLPPSDLRSPISDL